MRHIDNAMGVLGIALVAGGLILLSAVPVLVLRYQNTKLLLDRRQAEDDPNETQQWFDSNTGSTVPDRKSVV